MCYRVLANPTWEMTLYLCLGKYPDEIVDQRLSERPVNKRNEMSDDLLQG